MANTSLWGRTCLILLLTAAIGHAETDRGLLLLQKRYREAATDFRGSMHELANFCEANSYFSDAEELRKRAEPAAQQTLDIDELPDTVVPELRVNLPPLELQWRARQRKLEHDHALTLYKLSRDALHQGHVSFAFQLMREVAFHDPDHKFARSALGFVRLGDEWTTPYSATMTRKGNVDHPTFGWLPKAHVPRYEQGERNVQGKWISAEREAAIRSDFRYAWEIPTEHFFIKTNHSLEQGVQIGRELEEFHKFFVREYAAFFNTPQQMQRLFDKGEAASSTPGKRYTVYYFRNKDDFVKHLISDQPNIAITNGLYLPRNRIAYFYHQDQGDEANSETMFHEVTHQLLGESSSRTIDAGANANFWVVEGIACYMESYRRNGKHVETGMPGHPRFYWARERLITEQEYYSFPSFTALGMQQFQGAGDVATLQKYYAQAATMCHFFLNYREGLYRDAFLTYLAQVYSPSDRVRLATKPLDELTEVGFPTLEQQYREYVATLSPTPQPVSIQANEQAP